MPILLKRISRTKRGFKLQCETRRRLSRSESQYTCNSCPAAYTNKSDIRTNFRRKISPKFHTEIDNKNGKHRTSWNYSGMPCARANSTKQHDFHKRLIRQ